MHAYNIYEYIEHDPFSNLICEQNVCIETCEARIVRSSMPSMRHFQSRRVVHV